jgi:3-dehydroquinate synthase II
METSLQGKLQRELTEPKELIIEPDVPDDRLPEFLAQLTAEGIGTVYLDPAKLGGLKFETVYPSPAADYTVGTENAAEGKKRGMMFDVLSNQDIDDVLVSAEKGLDFVIVAVKDWKIIPLENIIAKLHKIDTRIFALAHSAREARKMFSILEVGVDGVIFITSSINEVREAQVDLGARSFQLRPAKIVKIQEVGDGERVCVDTASILRLGEGMLVGNRSNFLFLVHNESVGSSFTSPRPFRVNAGAVHCYTLSPDGTTSYLSEIEMGSEVLVLDSSGRARRAAVGRSKIERRPMLMIKATVDGEVGGIISQDAETIRFVRPDGELVSVTHLKKGDTVLVHSKAAAGRHFGMEVADEYILEK